MRDQRETSRLNYIAYKEHGVCVACGRRRTAPNRVRCEECLAKDAERHLKIRETKPVVFQAERAKKLRESRKAAGLCIWCGKPRSAHSKVFCVDCRIKNQRKNEKRKNGVSRSERVAYGLCYRCGVKIIPGEKLCDKCRQQSIDNLPDKPGVIQSWKADNKRVFQKKLT